MSIKKTSAKRAPKTTAKRAPKTESTPATETENANANTNANAPAVVYEQSDTLYERYTDILTAYADGSFKLNGRTLPIEIVVKNALFGLRVRKRNIKTNHKNATDAQLAEMFDDHLEANYAGFETISEHEKSLKQSKSDGAGAGKNRLETLTYIEIREHLGDKFDVFKNLTVTELLEMFEKNKPELLAECTKRAQVKLDAELIEAEKRANEDRERQLALLDSL